MKTILLTKGYYAKVDDDDYDRVNSFKWRAIKNSSGSVHAARMGQKRNKQKNIKMHRFILNAPKGRFVDHINYDCLDNRRKNLRLCTPHESSYHRRAKPNSSSKYKGVFWEKGKIYKGKQYLGKWQAQIKHNYKAIYIGRYDSEIEAAKAYDKKARELYGEFAELNFVDCQEKKGHSRPKEQ